MTALVGHIAVFTNNANLHSVAPRRSMRCQTNMFIFHLLL